MDFTRVVNTQLIDIQRLFFTPLACVRHPDAKTLNQALMKAINARMEQDQSGVTHSNRGGWQSHTDFSAWAGSAGEALLTFASDFATQLTAVSSPEHGLIEPGFTWKCDAWANVNQEGNSNAIHGHPGAFWSGVYWVDDGGRTEDPGVDGDLEFCDPRGLLPSHYNPSLRMRIEGCLTAGYAQSFAAKSGTLIMFPSWLLHSVRAFKGKRPRVSIAFNFSV
ncbi:MULTISPECIES: TIGR02466 family protein [Pseudomonas]|uniref:TIGR02466 family protein n=1 Tax=Pseudomonas TaxID=286 RepID=UPI00289DD662|nr:MULTISPECIES: TIGR02466 family protein [Pseudomonas]